MRHFLLMTASVAALLATACAHQQVSVTTPATPPASGRANGPATPVTTSPNIVPRRTAESDTAARPGWLNARITAVLAERKRNPITRILRYQFGGQTVYYVSAACCDQLSEVFDTKGQLICHPDGGITGKGDGKCSDFDKNKTDEKLVWQDPR